MSLPEGAGEKVTNMNVSLRVHRERRFEDSYLGISPDSQGFVVNQSPRPHICSPFRVYYQASLIDLTTLYGLGGAGHHY